MIDLVKNYSIIARRMKKSVLRELLKLTHRAEIISFAGGLPDPNAFPSEIIRDICRAVLEEIPEKALQYGQTEGDPELIEEIVKMLRSEGQHVSSDNILVTVASQQGLDLVAKIFIDPSDPIIVEMPSYIGGLQAFTCYGAHMSGVAMDDDGILVDELEKKLEMLRSSEEHYKILYLVPDFQNPSGVTLSHERRKRVLDLSHEYQILVVEDTPYRELRFEGEEPPSIYSMDTTQNVIALHTFSKIFVPGLRLGWVVAHPKIIQKMVVAKQSVDLCTPALSQAIAARFLKGGYLEPHIAKVNSIYKKKKDIMLQALSEYMPKDEGISWTKPQGGLFLWVRLPEYIDCDRMFYEAVEQNVAFVIGSAFFCHETGKNTMRLNFSYPSHEQIVEGIKRLAKVIEKNIVKRSFF